jgi:hypothetical protein
VSFINLSGAVFWTSWFRFKHRISSISEWPSHSHRWLIFLQLELVQGQDTWWAAPQSKEYEEMFNNLDLWNKICIRSLGKLSFSETRQKTLQFCPLSLSWYLQANAVLQLWIMSVPHIAAENTDANWISEINYVLVVSVVQAWGREIYHCLLLRGSVACEGDERNWHSALNSLHWSTYPSLQWSVYAQQSTLKSPQKYRNPAV